MDVTHVWIYSCLCVLIHWCQLSNGRPITRRRHKHQNGLYQYSRNPWVTLKLSTTLINMPTTKSYVHNTRKAYGRRNPYNPSRFRVAHHFRRNHPSTRRESQTNRKVGKVVKWHYERAALFRKCRHTSGKQRKTCILNFMKATQPELFVTETTTRADSTQPTTASLQDVSTTTTTISSVTLTVPVPTSSTVTGASTRKPDTSTLLDTSITEQATPSVIPTRTPSPSATPDMVPEVTTSPLTSTVRSSSVTYSKELPTSTASHSTPTATATSIPSTTTSALHVPLVNPFGEQFDTARFINIIPMATDMMCALCQQQRDADCINGWCSIGQ